MSTYPPDSSPRRLPEQHEARDLLLDAFEREGCCIAKFKFGEVALPPEILPKLREMVGRETAVLRLDGYHIREC